MTLIAALIVLLVVGIGMWLIAIHVPGPARTILLVICGVLIVVFIAQVTGLANFGAMRLGG